MYCPRCEAVLQDNILGGIVYQKCSKCGGFWFDKGELHQIRQEKDWFKIATNIENASSKITKGSLKCPRCSELLHTIEYSHETGIKVNVCPKCEGLWLDSTEIQAIKRATETWGEKLKEKVGNDLIAIELFLIKMGPQLPR